ncbi:MAG: hypothetical protein IPJ17_10335 [Holophagales bacterium]|nr:MAG: hypothetical protein IPJ17_10335 [Holophagales bacterium]
MRQLLVSSFVFALVISAVGCSKSGGNAAAPVGGGAVAAAPTGGGPSVASTGVAECDQYIRKYMDCIASKVPEAARAQYQAAFDQTVATWKAVAVDPNGKAGLAAACKAAETAAAPAMQAYGCTF